MIYGVFFINPSDKLIKKVDIAGNIFGWSDSIHCKLEASNFRGGIFYNKKLPYKNDDFNSESSDKNIFVLISGNIYNKKELNKKYFMGKCELCDPQLILNLYKTLKCNFINELNGDFAIFILDKESKKCYLIRDHMGIRPLAYYLSDQVLWFSTDSYGLSKLLFSKEAVNAEFIKNIFVNYGLQSKPLLPDYTVLPNDKIKNILPGHYLETNFEMSASQYKYWYPESGKTIKNLSFDSAFNELDFLVKDSIKLRCDSRFKASAHLSGGIDSATVASLVRREYGKQNAFYGFSWTPPVINSKNIKYNETEYIEKICRKSNIFPVYCSIGVQEYLNFLSCNRFVCDLFYEPTIRKIAKENSINLIFSGYGGDEFISLNNLGIDSDLFFKLQWRAFFKKNSFKPKKLIKVFILYVILPALKLRYYSKKKPIHRYSKYLLPFDQKLQKTINDLYYWKSRKEVHLHWLYDYHLQERIEDWYINGLRDGIEYRYPLLDKRIVEYIFKVPSKILFQGDHSRIMLRKIGEPFVPKEVIWSESKNDPLRLDALKDLYDEVCKALFKQISHFEENSYLKMIDFELLKSDIEAYEKKELSGNPSELFEILIAIKKIDEFTAHFIDLQNIKV